MTTSVKTTVLHFVNDIPTSCKGPNGIYARMVVGGYKGKGETPAGTISCNLTWLWKEGAISRIKSDVLKGKPYMYFRDENISIESKCPVSPAQKI